MTEPPVFDEKASAIEEIKAAVARAGPRRQKVLVVWGANTSRWSRYMHRSLTKTPDVNRVATAEYQVVFADIGKGDRNMDAASAFGADLLTHGIPYLTFIDPLTGAAAGRGTDDLQSINQSMLPGYEGAKVITALREHQNPPLEARSVLEGALAKAKAEGKKVLFVAREPQCAWCDRWDEWLLREDVRTRLEKDVLPCVIDMERMTGGGEVVERVAGNVFEAAPLYVMLDAEGKPLATSLMPRAKEEGGARNIGFPQAEEEIRHFAGALKKAKSNMTDEDVEAVLAAMRPKRQ